jgi:CDP-glucose 4,6-dehydratase
MGEAEPQFVFHLAAQPLVRESYRDPLGTFATNVMGTVHLLEVLRQNPSVESIVIITTDKVYLNREWDFPYREIDPLGGHDPYSASKAAVEIVAASYRSSFLASSGDASPGLATARAGNVIGGGDWARDRLVPDCLRAFERGEPVRLRFPQSVRPWQHVLDALSGYLQLGAAVVGAAGARHATAYNFGPDPSGDASVGDVARRLASNWGEGARVVCEKEGDVNPHEAGLLRLDSSRARQILGWRPHWNLEESLARTVDWHRAWRAGGGMRMFSLSQIEEYGKALRA